MSEKTITARLSLLLRGFKSSDRFVVNIHQMEIMNVSERSVLKLQLEQEIQKSS
jgi:hypothetical protein